MHAVHRSALLLQMCRGLSVCLSVGHNSEPCKNGWTDWDAVWNEDSGRPEEPCTRVPQGKGQFWGMSWPIVKCREYPAWAKVPSSLGDSSGAALRRQYRSSSFLYTSGIICRNCHCASVTVYSFFSVCQDKILTYSDRIAHVLNSYYLFYFRD